MFQKQVLELATTNGVSKRIFLHTANNQKRNVGMARNETIKLCMGGSILQFDLIIPLHSNSISFVMLVDSWLLVPMIHGYLFPNNDQTLIRTFSRCKIEMAQEDRYRAGQSVHVVITTYIHKPNGYIIYKPISICLSIFKIHSKLLSVNILQKQILRAGIHLLTFFPRSHSSGYTIKSSTPTQQLLNDETMHSKQKPR